MLTNGRVETRLMIGGAAEPAAEKKQKLISDMHPRTQGGGIGSLRASRRGYEEDILHARPPPISAHHMRLESWYTLDDLCTYRSNGWDRTGRTVMRAKFWQGFGPLRFSPATDSLAESPARCFSRRIRILLSVILFLVFYL